MATCSAGIPYIPRELGEGRGGERGLDGRRSGILR